jgi:hypothetical protein
VDKLDVRRDLVGYRARRGVFDVVELPPRRFLAVDGAGDPNTSASYRDALATLYPAAYALKFLSKAGGADYAVPPLEALWWADDLAAFTSVRDKGRWSWRAMILVPDVVPGGLVAQALAAPGVVRAPAADRLGVVELDEATVVQTLHIGPYDDEGPVLARMHDEVIPSLGRRPGGHHHEIYLSDARRTAPEKLRTILRQPVIAAEAAR